MIVRILWLATSPPVVCYRYAVIVIWLDETVWHCRNRRHCPMRNMSLYLISTRFAQYMRKRGNAIGHVHEQLLIRAQPL